MTEESDIAEYLARVDTLPLQREGIPTVALVVFNFSETAIPPSRVRFHASFPVREPKPVTVRDADGVLVPSRLTEETVDDTASNLPPGRVLWSLTLEFAVVDGIPPYTARTFGASYEKAIVDGADAFLSTLPLMNLPVYETDCHAGNVPLTFSL